MVLALFCFVLKFEDEFLLRRDVCNIPSISNWIPCIIPVRFVLVLVVGVSCEKFLIFSGTTRVRFCVTRVI